MDLQLWSRLLGILRHIRIPSSRLKVGERLPLELELWSRLGCFGILRHMRIPSPCLKAGGRPPLDLQLWSRLGCFGILRYIRIPSSQLKVGGRPPLDLQLWSPLGCFGILQYMRIPNSWLNDQKSNLGQKGNSLSGIKSTLKVGGRPPLDLQLWSRLGSFGHSHWNLKPAGLQD